MIAALVVCAAQVKLTKKHGAPALTFEVKLAETYMQVASHLESRFTLPAPPPHVLSCAPVAWWLVPLETVSLSSPALCRWSTMYRSGWFTTPQSLIYMQASSAGRERGSVYVKGPGSEPGLRFGGQ